ncbi:MAG TPA: hypothetical protein VJN18_02330 [Polyangiaceae bacterium]|nr:hypothetical protein [Polyangiaceae bacterium]
MLTEAALLAVLSLEHGPGADGCLSQPELERSVEKRLKRRVFVPEAEAQLRLRVRFIQQDSRIEARIDLASHDGTPRGTRSLVTTGHCSKLDDSLALSVALLVDQPPEPEPSASSPLTPAAPTPSETKQAPPARRVIEIPPEVSAPREPWQVGVVAAGKGIWGALPGINPAAMLAIRMVPPHVPSIFVQGEAYWPATAERDADSGARFRLLRVGLSICPALVEAERTNLGLCVGQQLGWLRAQGYGFDHDATQKRLSYALRLGGEGGVRLFTPIRLRAYLGADVPLVRDHFISGGAAAQRLFRPAPVGLEAEIGLEARLW